MIQLVADWRPLWPWVQEGLAAISKRLNTSWMPEDVYVELKSGAATLATIADGAGFLVLKRLQDYDGQVLFVWIVHGPNKLRQHYEEVFSDVAELAKQSGCIRVQMRSPRRGWARVGWTERETIYEREV